MSSQYERVDPQILGARLRTAREANGKTQQDAADAIGVARTTIVAMEKGERKPRPTELTQFAQIYAQDLQWLLQPYEPLAPDQEVLGHFRRTARVDAGLEQRIQACVAEAQAILLEYRELEVRYGARHPHLHAPDYLIPNTADQEGLALSPSLIQLAEEVAGAERQRLALSDGPIQDLFDVLEEQEEGLSIFQLDLPATVSALYALDQHLGPFIIINPHHDAGRRHWSLAHEYAHVLTRGQFPGGKILFSAMEHRVPQSERFANAFATAFLLPATSVGRGFHRIQETQGEFQTGDIMRMAHRFRVSFEAMGRRLEDLQLIPVGTTERLKARGYRPREALAKQQLDPIQVSQRRLPLRYEYLVCMAAEKGRITQEEAMRYLNTDRIAARERMLTLSRHAFVTESGTMLTLEIPFVANKGA